MASTGLLSKSYVTCKQQGFRDVNKRIHNSNTLSRVDKFPFELPFENNNVN